MKEEEKEWQNRPRAEREERMLCTVSKVVYREIQIILLDQTIQMGKK